MRGTECQSSQEARRCPHGSSWTAPGPAPEQCRPSDKQVLGGGRVGGAGGSPPPGVQQPGQRAASQGASPGDSGARTPPCAPCAARAAAPWQSRQASGTQGGCTSPSEHFLTRLRFSHRKAFSVGKLLFFFFLVFSTGGILGGFPGRGGVGGAPEATPDRGGVAASQRQPCPTPRGPRHPPWQRALPLKGSGWAARARTS